MGLLDDAIREHLELKRRHGASENELARQEAEALGPARRETVAEAAPGPEPELDPLSSAPPGYADSPPEAPVDETMIAEPPFAEPLDGAPPAGMEPPAPDLRAELAPEGAEPVPGLPESGAEPVDLPPTADPPAEPVDLPPRAADLPPEPAIPDPEPPDLEPSPPPAPPAPESDLPAAPGPGPPLGAPEEAPPPVEEPELDAPGPAAPIDETRIAPPPAAPEVELDEPDEVPADESLDHRSARDEDVLEETPEFLQETPEHDRLWFEQKPPRDFDFDE